MASVKNAVRYRKKDGSYSLVLTAEQPEEYHVEKRTQELLDKMTLEWFPTSWLTFVCVGVPAAWVRFESFSTGGSYDRMTVKDKAAASAVSRKPGINHETTEEADDHIRQAMSKAGRRHHAGNMFNIGEQSDRSAKKGKPASSINLVLHKAASSMIPSTYI